MNGNLDLRHVLDIARPALLEYIKIHCCTSFAKSSNTNLPIFVTDHSSSSGNNLLKIESKLKSKSLYADFRLK